MIKENIAYIQKEIRNICEKKLMNSEDISLIAVTKTKKSDIINEAINCGIVNIGENKVQEVLEKYDQVEKKVKWHLIGHLQSNKVKYIIDKVDLIHSVDSIDLAKEISKKAKQHQRTMDILIQVNVAKEESKFGIALENVVHTILEISKMENIKIKGLMTIAPNFEDVEKTRPIFCTLKQKFDQIQKENIANVEMKYLSMGMTGDYKIAIEEGANLIRIGTGIFGKRDYNI